MLRKTALTQPAGQRSAVGTLTLSLAVKDQGGGEGRLRRGMAGVQAWPPGLDYRRPFFDENPRQGVYLQLPIPVPQMRSGLPRYVPPSAHDSWQVLLFQGKSCSHFRSFTTKMAEPRISFPGFLGVLYILPYCSKITRALFVLIAGLI